MRASPISPWKPKDSFLIVPLYYQPSLACKA
jgi:hypothetical protein